MSGSSSAAFDSAKARELWAEYQRRHDVSDRTGHAVRIDPVSGRIWFGREALDIARQMRALGIDRPFYCVRVGSVEVSMSTPLLFQLFQELAGGYDSRLLKTA